MPSTITSVTSTPEIFSNVSVQAAQTDSDDSSSSVAGVVAGCVVSVVICIAIIIALAIFLVWCHRKRSKDKGSQGNYICV